MVPRTRIQQFARSQVNTSNAMPDASSLGPNLILPSAWTSSWMAPARTRGRMSSENVLGGAFLFRSQLAGVARALLLLGDWGFQWPSLRQAPSGPCIFEPGGVFFRDWKTH